MMPRMLMLLALTLGAFPAQADVWDHVTGYFKERERPAAPTLRVLLVHGAEEVKLEVHGKYSLFDPYTHARLSRRLAGKSRSIRDLGEGLKWGEAFPDLHQIQIKPDSANTVIGVDDREYEGSIYVYGIEGTVSVVNQVPIEAYTRSILHAYQHLELEKEALAALAIAIRTNAYFQALNPKNGYWSVDAEKVHYEGVVPVPAPIDEAMRQTHYMIASKTGVYEGAPTPFPAQFPGPNGQMVKGGEPSKISLQEANEMAKKGDHAAQILAKAFPGSIIMLIP